MKTRLIASFILSLCFATTLQAQVKYTVITDNVKQVRPFSITLNPCYGDYYLENTRAAWNAQLQVLLFQRLELRMSYLQSYTDIASGNAGGLNVFMPSAGLGSTADVELGGSIFILDWNKPKDIKLLLSNSELNTMAYTRSIIIPAHRRTQIGLRGGLKLMTNHFQLYEDIGTQLYLQNKSAANDTLHFGPSEQLKDGKNINTAFATQTQSMIYAGIALRKMIDLVVEVEGYKSKKKNRLLTDLYADFLLSNAHQLSDLKGATTEYALKYENTAFQKYGWRVGCNMKAPRSTHIAFQIEAGSYPGLKIKGMTLSNYFLQIGMGINIPFGPNKAIEPAN